MRFRDIDITQFKKTQELYQFLDDTIIQFDYYWDIVDLWVEYRNYTKINEEKEMAQWEINSFSFNFKGAFMFSSIYSVGKAINEIQSYPNLNEMEKAAINYLEVRADTSDNPIFKARYFHILWKVKRHRESAIFAIEAYLQSINNYLEKFEERKKGLYVDHIEKHFETLVGLCNEVKSHYNELTELSEHLLFKNDLKFHAIFQLVQIMLDYNNIFKAASFDKILPLFEEEIKNAKDPKDDFTLVNYYLPVAIRIANKIKSDVKCWHNQMGISFLRLAEKETESDRNWLKAQSYSKAMYSFKLAGNKQLLAETKKKYSDLKPHIVLNNVEIEFNQTVSKIYEYYRNYIDQNSTKLLIEQSETLYHTISRGILFPQYAVIKRITDSIKPDLEDYCLLIKIDINQNITRTYENVEFTDKIMEIYSFQLFNFTLNFLHKVIIEGIKSGKLTFSNMIHYLADKTWIGKDHYISDLGGERKNQNWISLLAPSIVEFFLHIQAQTNSKFYTPNYIMCIDSLTLKLEGLLRNFCERAGIPVIKEDARGVRMMYIHEILGLEEIRQYFDLDDILYFNFLLLNQGMNMRNNIAHCFYSSDDYKLGKMLLLIAAVLRLGKYNYSENNGKNN